MSKLLIEKVEKAIYNWTFKNRYKVVTAFVLSFLIYFGTFLPYFNLYLTKESVPVIILLVVALIVNVRASWLVVLGLFLFLIAFVFELLGRYKTSEGVGNFIYALFLFATLKSIFLLKRLVGKKPVSST